MAKSSDPGCLDARPLQHSSSYEFLPPNMSELRVVLLGSSWSQRSSVGNLLVGGPAFNPEGNGDLCQIVSGRVEVQELVLVNTPDVLLQTKSEVKLSEIREDIWRLCTPGPHVLLLVLQPETFTEESRRAMCDFLTFCSSQAFNHSLVVTTTPSGADQCPSSLKDMIKRCRYRQVWQEELEPRELLTRLGQTVKENGGRHLNWDSWDAGLVMGKLREQRKPVLNLVLCGRRGAGKTSVAGAILGLREIRSNPEESVKNQAEVFGRQVSVVELPALFGKAQQEVMQEFFRCVSLCEPEGVHAFILVLPVGPLTDEDKGELEVIQGSFGPQVSKFTRIMFTTESNPNDPAVAEFVEKDIDAAELCKRCKGRFSVINTKYKHQIQVLIQTEGHINPPHGGDCGFTKDLFTRALMESLISLQTKRRSPLRMVLLGKSGSGKSSTANTILGRDFPSGHSPTAPTRVCGKASGEAGGWPLTVVDTTALSKAQQLRAALQEAAPGPHVLLLVLQLGNITEEDKNFLDLIETHLGHRWQDFTVVVFTRGDDLSGAETRGFLNKCPEFVQVLVRDCGGRYQVFKNQSHDKQGQVRELMSKIDKMSEGNESSFYSSKTEEDTEARKAREQREQELRRRHKEELKALQAKLLQERSEMQQQLKEKEQLLQKEQKERKAERGESERKHRSQTETQRQQWRERMEEERQKLQAEKQRREQAEKKVEREMKEIKKERDAWDREKSKMWEHKYQEVKEDLEKEKKSNKILQDKYQQRRRMWTVVLVLLTGFLALSFRDVFW